MNFTPDKVEQSTANKLHPRNPKRVLGKFLLMPVIAGGIVGATFGITQAVGISSSAIAQSWGINSPQSDTSQAQPTEPDGPSNAPSVSPPTRKVSPLVTNISEYEAYGEVIERTKSMIRDPAAQRLASEHGLQVLDITWEDTGRYDNSSVGPNISDMTIQVEHRDPRTGEAQLHLMPVIRYPNFSDLTADVPMQKLSVLTGNEKGEAVESTSLAEVLEDLRRYLSAPDSWKGDRTSLLAARDSHVLVSAQAAFLPIPKSGVATFNPVLFNYQSYPGDPAVLTILATREGTSTTVIDNQRDGFGAGRTWGQRLFFNKDGDRASLTGKRISDFNQEQTNTSNEGISLPPVEVTEADGVNMVMLIQVPLKQKDPFLSGSVASDSTLQSLEIAPSAPMAAMSRAESNVEAAVIGHGPVEGPFTEIDDLAIERDPNFPIRVTVQFYKATDNGIVSEKDLADIDAQIQRIYDDADYVGSLVTDGRTRRPTEYDGEHTQPEDWWEAFWEHSANRQGLGREAAMDLLRRLRGENGPKE